MKTCNKCGGPNRTKTQRWCTDCKRAYNRRYYSNQQNREALRRRNKENQVRFFKWYLTLKEGPCTDCGKKFHHAAMEWDHLPDGEKLGAVSDLVRHGNRKKLLDEIAKCELVCRNCHAVRTWERKRRPSGLTDKALAF